MNKPAYVYWYHLKEHGLDKLQTEGYVGVTVDLKSRHAGHTRHRQRTITVIRSAFQKYGEEQIIRTLLFKGDVEEAYALEKKLRPMPKIGWNLTTGGGLPPDPTGRVHSEETKQKMSKNNARTSLGKTSQFKGKTGRWSEEAKRRIGQAHIGQIISQSHRQAIYDKLHWGNSSMAKQIHLVHKDRLDEVYTFSSISEAAAKLKLNYSRIRSLYQTAHRTQKAAGRSWFCLCEHHLTNPKKAIQEAQEHKSKVRAATPKAKGKDNYQSQEITIEHKNGTVLFFEAIIQAAQAINMSDATLRYHIAQTKKKQKDANYTRSGWRVKYKEVRE